MTNMLSVEQQRRALEVMREYLAAPKNPDGQTLEVVQAERDRKRLQLIQNDLQPLVSQYLDGRIALRDFKSQVDGTNKRNAYWGFQGIKGQMFFNMVVNVAGDTSELDHELKVAIIPPVST